jgi:tellurite resistance protein
MKRKPVGNIYSMSKTELDDIVDLLKQISQKNVWQSEEDAELIEIAADEICKLRKEVRRCHLNLMVAYAESAGMYESSESAVKPDLAQLLRHVPTLLNDIAVVCKEAANEIDSLKTERKDIRDK